MLQVDQAILDTNKVICKNIAVFDTSERGLLSQNILSQLRNFVEYIVQKVYSKGIDTDPNDYQDKKAAWGYVKTRGDLRFLTSVHNGFHFYNNSKGGQYIFLLLTSEFFFPFFNYFNPL